MNHTEDTCGARKPGWENGPAIGRCTCCSALECTTCADCQYSGHCRMNGFTAEMVVRMTCGVEIEVMRIGDTGWWALRVSRYGIPMYGAGIFTAMDTDHSGAAEAGIAQLKADGVIPADSVEISMADIEAARRGEAWAVESVLGTMSDRVKELAHSEARQMVAADSESTVVEFTQAADVAMWAALERFEGANADAFLAFMYQTARSAITEHASAMQR